jgi:hypothetical protein
MYTFCSAKLQYIYKVVHQQAGQREKTDKRREYTESAENVPLGQVQRDKGTNRPLFDKSKTSAMNARNEIDRIQ